MKNLKVRLTFTEEVLGTASSNPEIHEEFIASKAPDAKSTEQEVAAIGVEAAVEKAMTVFPRMADGTPFLYDYQVRGYFKEVCSVLRQVSGMKSKDVKAFKKKIDGLVFVEPRQIPFVMPSEGAVGSCQRPLRASTAQGERVSLANSETIPAGSTVEFTVICFIDDDVELVKEWLDYGIFKGLGQWRNSGKGKFKVEYLEEDGDKKPKSKSKSKKSADEATA